MDISINEPNKGPAGNSEHIVKVQLSITSSFVQRQVIIYNEDRSLHYQGSAGQEIVNLMGDKLKAFFHASLNEKGMISLDGIADPEDW